MNLLLSELQKLVRTYKLILLIILALSAKFFLLAAENSSSDAYLVERHAEFQEIVNQYAGPLSEEKIRKIEKTFLDVSNIEVTIKQIRRSYEQEKITREAYYRDLTELNNLLGVRDLFLIFYRQYSYAKENPAQRYILDQLGWNALIAAPRFDWGCILLISIVGVAIFASEYENEMVPILITTKRGNRALVTAKIAAVLLLTIVTALLSIGIETAFFYFKYSLPNPTFPVQSLPFFENCPYSIQLIEAFILITAIRIAGFIVFACASMLAGAFFKSSVLGAFISLGYIVFPYALSLPENIINILPAPLRLLFPQFIFGGIDNAAAEEMIQSGTNLNSPAALYRFGFFWLLGLILMVFLLYKLFIFRKKPLFRRNQNRHKYCIGFLIISFCFPFFYASSVSADDYGEPKAINLWDSFYAGFIEDRFITLYPSLMIERTDGNGMERLIRDPFLSPEEIQKQILSIASTGNEICYVINPSTFIKIDCVQISDLSHKTIFYKQLKRTSGIIQRYFVEQYERNQTRHFYIGKDKSLYLLESNDLYRIDPNGKNRKHIIRNILGINISFSDDRITYLTNLNELHTYDLKTREGIQIPDVHSDFFIQHGKDIYYRNIDESGKIFKYDTVKRSNQEAAPFESSQFRVSDDYLYYAKSDQGNNLFRYKFATHENELLLEESVFNFYITDRYVYVLALSGLYVSKIIKIDKHTLERKIIWEGLN